ncbi:DNA repair protein RAD14 [Colletotrichum orbiculare MAFF 240422]|uniref:DNA repair protein RAD14 n=1 Tax=Colletotrichum orbiculare (strain 104-T / ATCC 96160 / CBS 514.97 / LARS 414 / MAFF 240422) TaxID=1213857 RepID=N4UN21_COLOR|nr:DNA repair protein RAD14 [Colletotrichum orbiculare MAFF 240422]
MERPKTPPRKQPTAVPPISPPTPAATRRLEESRLRSKAIRSHREADEASSGVPSAPKTSSGFIATQDVHITRAGAYGSDLNRKRPHSSISSADPLPTNRDARDTASAAPLRAAKNFAKFVDYNMSAMTDTKGGFLTAEDDPHNTALIPRVKPGGPPQEEKPKGMTSQEWERLQLLRKLRRQKAGPFEPGLSVLADSETRKKCSECSSFEIDWVWDEVFGIQVCHACKDTNPDKYSLLTKTECKEDYLLTDEELKDADLLPHLSRPNPHKSHWHDMMLFLRCQVEEYAFTTKWGSAERLDAEFAKREADKKRRKEAKFREKLNDLKRKTRTEAIRRQQAAGAAGAGPRKFGDSVGGGKHVHDWGRAVENDEGMTVKKCNGCGMEVEELEL